MSVGAAPDPVPQALWDALDGAHWELVTAVAREGRDKALAERGADFNKAVKALAQGGATSVRTITRIKGLDGERNSAVYSLIHARLLQEP
jgi:hypothetical protein